MTTPATATNPNSTPFAPLDIEISFPAGSTYKSITSLKWSHIPPFAVLTGRNGVGKSQLLELLGIRGAQINTPHTAALNNVSVKFSDPLIAEASIAYLPSTWTIEVHGAVSMVDMKARKQSLWNEIQPHNANGQVDLKKQMLYRRIRKIIKWKPNEGMTQEEFFKRLPDDFSFMLDESDVSEGLVHVFMGYRAMRLLGLENGTPVAEVEEKLGPPPWKVLNDILKTADFTYEVQAPVGNFFDPFEIILEDKAAGLHLKPNDLSSGEKMLLRVVMWLYGAQRHARFPRLMLLDEPDAHLHPSMTRLFLNVIEEVLVNKYQVRVIMTTHSPSTVALAPAESIFEMSKVAPRIRPTTRTDAIGLLTAGLVTVAPGSRFVLVEDQADVTFYQTIWELLTDFGPSKDSMALAPAPTLAFLPVSLGTGSQRISGGKSVVQGWVDKFDQPPLAEIFRGFVDRDAAPLIHPRIYVLARYSIENYLVDPFVVYALLVANGKAPPIPGIAISAGDEHLIKSLNAGLLKLIVDAVGGMIESLLPAPDKSPVNVSFTNGASVPYPKWMIETRGHDLFQLYQSTLGTPGSFSPPKLLYALRRVRLLPVEFAQVLVAIQQS